MVSSSGWQCPKCGAVWAPFVEGCRKCDGQKRQNTQADIHRLRNASARSTLKGPFTGMGGRVEEALHILVGDRDEQLTQAVGCQCSDVPNTGHSFNCLHYSPPQKDQPAAAEPPKCLCFTTDAHRCQVHPRPQTAQGPICTCPSNPAVYSDDCSLHGGR